MGSGGGLGELGLLLGNLLSNQLYPLPADELPAQAYGSNPFPSDAQGAPDLSGAYKTSKISCCTGWGDGSPTPALWAAHTYSTVAAPLDRGYMPAQELPCRPPSYRLDERERGSAGWRAAGCH